MRSKVNSGAGIARNTGIGFSRGEYIMFIDSDDAIIPSTLTTFYNYAKKFEADVVCSENFYETENSLNSDDMKMHIQIPEEQPPLLISDDLEERVKKFCSVKITSSCNKMISRRLLCQEGFEFIQFDIGEDEIFSLFIFCTAKKFVHISDITYIYRHHSNSLTRRYRKSVEHHIHSMISSVSKGIQAFDKLMMKFDLFQKKTEFKYAIFEKFLNDKMTALLPIYAQIPAHLLDPLIRRELSEVKDKTALTAFLFARMNLLNVQLIQAQNLLRQQPKEVQDFQRQNEIIQRQQAQIQELQQQLRNVHDVFR